MLDVLVVDDSKFMARAIKRILEGQGFNVVAIGHDGQEGFDLFKEHTPAVTLLDITMPNICGVECLALIREIDSDARVVMLSAIQDASVVDECMQLGAHDFLSKPIRRNNVEDEERLKATVEQAARSIA